MRITFCRSGEGRQRHPNQSLPDLHDQASLGYKIMKGIMAKYSSEEHQGVASFKYGPASPNQRMFEFMRPLDDLESMLLTEFAGQTLTVEEIYNRHNVGKPYVEELPRRADENGARESVGPTRLLPTPKRYHRS